MERALGRRRGANEPARAFRALACQTALDQSHLQAPRMQPAEVHRHQNPLHAAAALPREADDHPRQPALLHTARRLHSPIGSQGFVTGRPRWHLLRIE